MPFNCWGVSIFFPPALTQQPLQVRLHASLMLIITKAGKNFLPFPDARSNWRMFCQLRKPKFQANFHSSRMGVCLTIRQPMPANDVQCLNAILISSICLFSFL